MLKLWSYLVNTFEINTRKAPTKMLRIGNDHDSRLKAEMSDPDINALRTFFNSLLLVFQTLYSAWKASISVRMSRTLSLTREFKLLSEEWIRAWEGKVHNFYPEGNPAALAIFPNKRNPFQVGTYEERMMAVKTLAENLAPYENLRTLQEEVQSKYAILENARDVQKQAMTNVERNSSDLEKQRIELVQAMYKILGTLMAKFYKNPPDVERFYNLSLIRRASTDSSGIFNQSSSVNTGITLVIQVPKKFEMSINVNFIFANSEGGGELHFFFADSASATDSPNKATVQPGETLESTAGEMGWSTSNSILIVKNAGTLTAEYELTAME